MKALLEIQSKLKAPKSQFNSFGKYKYRNCEDILEAVKPLLKEHGLTLTINDEIVMIGTRYYVRAGVTIADGKETVSLSAYAREEESKKGMDGAQVTGAASSYARKYALNGLFLIDDTKDSDTTNTGKEEHLAEHESATKPPQHSHTNPGVMAPKDGGVKTATGLIMDKREKNKGGYCGYAIEGYLKEIGKPIYFATKDEIIMETLDERRADSKPVSIEYTETQNGDFVNYNIVGLVAVEIPF